MREVVNAETGILVKPEDVDGYAKAILQLDLDREDLAKKSLAARQAAKNRFSCEAMADRWLKMFGELPSAPSQWPESQKVAYSMMMRRLGLPFLPAFRPVGKLINRVAGRKPF
jgi:hypothetical protein